MAIGYGVAAPKGEPRKRIKGRKDRAEATLKKAVRAECVERDGDCRICDWEMNPADLHEDELLYPDEYGVNPSEWAHLEDHRRSKTRRMKPVLRHTTMGTAMLCRFHHREYDARRLRLRFLTSLGADGPMEFYTP